MSLQVWLPLNKEGNFLNLGLLGDISVVNAPSFGSSGKIGSACMTTGSFKLSALQTSKVLNNELFSFASWIYITLASGSTILFGNSLMSASNNRRFTIFLYNTLLRIHLSWLNYDSNDVVSGSGTVTGDIIPINTWTHIAVTYSSSTNKATIYVNGVKSVDYTIGKFTSPTYAYETTLMENSNTVYYNDYRLYNHCLSPKEVHEIAKGLVLHYPMNDEYVESTVYDCSGYCNNGTVTGSLQVVDDSPRYKKSTKITTSNTIETTVPVLNNNYSFSWWYNKADFGAGDMMWGYSDGNRINPLYSLCFNIGDGTDSPWYVPGTTTKITAPSGNTWHHFVITGDGSTSKLYIDGILYGICINFKPIIGSILHINGWSSGGDYRTNGNISDFRIYSTTLSEDDIKELYNTSAWIANNGTIAAYELNEE